MKINESKIVRTSPIGELPNGKVTVHLSNDLDSNESIWVAKDQENKVMYLLNHAVAFFPFPSWGMELPLQQKVDLLPYRGQTPDDAEFTVCKEAYDIYKEYINEETHEFDTERFLEDQSKPKES